MVQFPVKLRKVQLTLWIILLSVFLFHLCYWPPIEVRLTSFACILIGLCSPVLSLYALALFGALYLENPGVYYNSGQLECLVVSALIHQAIKKYKKVDLPQEPKSANTVFFLSCAAGVFCILLASSITGMVHYFQEKQSFPYVSQFTYLFGTPIWGRATDSAWTPKSLLNWMIGFGIASIAYQHATHWVISRFYKFASAALIIVCLLGLFDYWFYPNHRAFLLLQLKETFSTANPDPLHAGRFSATATHAGWLGQWIVLTFPGFFVWYRTSGSSRKKLVFVALGGFVLVCFFLTLARAPWLGMLVSFGVVAVLTSKRFSGVSATTVGAIVGTVFGALLIAFLVVPQLFARRIETLFQVSDRLNYVYSSLDLLWKFPLGIGLGTHFPLYSDYFLPTYRYYQKDHVEIHNTVFHLITENSIFVMLPILLGLMGIACLAKPVFKQMSEKDEILFQALLASLLGILVVSLAQYIFYIRSVELFIWVVLGFFAGMLQKQTRLPKRLLVLQTPLLIVCLIAASVIAVAHIQREPWKLDPRYTERDAETDYESRVFQKWTKNQAEFAVDSDVQTLKFSLFTLQDVGNVTITWPNGESESFELPPNETRFFERALQPAERTFPSRWLTLECDRTWRPVDYLEGSKDYRELGVFISGLEFVKDSDQ